MIEDSFAHELENQTIGGFPKLSDPSQYHVSIDLPLGEQQEIVAIAQQFKQATVNHYQQKKNTMRRCYAYFKSQFYGDDLLPTPATEGQDRDNNSNRPQIFMPMTRQQAKILYSFLKLTLLPNDEDFFRIRGENASSAEHEEILTQGIMHLLREALFSEKGGEFILDTIWAGNAVAFPTILRESHWEWSVDMEAEAYVPILKEAPPRLVMEVWNPLHFYPDPYCKEPENSKWGYFSFKKLYEILDSPRYQNKDQLKLISQRRIPDSQDQSGLTLSGFNRLSSGFMDTEENVKVDKYYFPYLKTSQREYRNMLVGVAGEQVLIEFSPNFMAKGLNPVVFQTWMNDKDSALGTGPVEDMAEIQRLLNMGYNYAIELLARIGNRFIVRPGVDLSNFFGVAGGVATTDNPREDVVAMTGDFVELVHLFNFLGIVKSEGQLVAGSKDPFQGGSNIDFKKTATEIQLLQENSVSILREIVQHVGIGLKRIIERFMYLAADFYQDPFQIRLSDPMTGVPQYVSVDFSVLKSGSYRVELMGVNPSQSKAAQIQGLIQLLQLVTENPDSILVGEQIITQIAGLQGIKNVQSLLDEIKQKLNQRQERNQK
ncbi:MAG: hypothetical protein K2X66_12410 [Cyanobacteria bacterium]|nr:hypothetical protein [Cyanobacteriota bacterium]